MKLHTAFVSIALLLGAVSARAETVYKVGSTPTGIPFTFLDPQTNQIQGMMVDVIEAVAKEQGFKVEIRPMEFSALVSSLAAGKIDVISAAMSANPERGKVVTFSNDVYTYGEGVVVANNNGHGYKSLGDMKGLKVGAQVGTDYLDKLKKSGLFSDVVAYDTLPDLMRDVSNGRVDAGVGDSPIMAYNLSQGRFPKLHLVKSYQPSMPGPINMAVKKGNSELLDKINASVAHMKADGRLDAIKKKWGM